MTDLEKKYLAENLDNTVKELESKGYSIKIVKSQGNKDNDILTDERIISIKKLNDEIILTTSFFKLEM